MLTVKNLHAYYGKSHILQGVDMKVGDNEIVSILGRNGVGRSTTLKAIMGDPEPQGEIEFNDTPIAGLKPHDIACRGIGYVPEERAIFPSLTVEQNLILGLKPGRKESRWGLEQTWQLFPQLKERADAPGGALSGGEQQMLTIARTLMGNPSLLLLDEPSEGIAPVIVEQMAATILKLKAEGLTVMISEQNLHFARAVADRAIIIEGGEKKFDGSFKELEAHPEIRDAYLSV